MDRDFIIRLINANLQSVKEDYGVKHLFLFGSVARNSASSESDIDLLVEFSRPTGLFGLLSLQLFLEKVLEKKVDLGTYQSLKPYIKTDVDKDMLLVV